RGRSPARRRSRDVPARPTRTARGRGVPCATGGDRCAWARRAGRRRRRARGLVMVARACIGAIGVACLVGCLLGCNSILGAGEPTVDGGGGSNSTDSGSTTASSGEAIGAGGRDSDDPDPPGPAAPTCGDGEVDPDEDCDDGNVVDGDGCSSTCGLECGERE